MSAEVTVLIPVYNREQYILTAINSVLSQTYRRWKILLVDDGSTDNTIAVIEKNVSKDTPLAIIRNPTNLGQSRTLNVGLEQINTPYLVQLDSDDLFLPFTLDIMIKEAQKRPKDVAALYGNYLKTMLDNHGAIAKTILRKGRSYRDRYHFLSAKQTLRPRFFRTAALKAIGGWPTDDPYQGRYAEDIRVLTRLIEHYRFYWIDQVLYIYNKHLGNLTNEKDIYHKALDWILFDTLKRWGNKYTPIFDSKPRGWRTFKGLIPNRNKKSH